MDPTQEKPCRVCHHTKPLDDFPSRKSAKDGRDNRCRLCTSVYLAAYNEANKERMKPILQAYRDSHKEETRVYGLTYRVTHAPQIAARLAGNRQERLIKHVLYNQEHKEASLLYAETHKDKTKARAAAAYAANPKTFLTRNKAWAKAHPEAMTAGRHRRRSRQAGATLVDLSPEQFAEICRIRKYRCAYCPPDCQACRKKTHKLHQEHVEPVSKGGNYTVQNIVPSCISCNSKKHTGPPPIPVQLEMLTEAPPKTPRTRRKN